MRTFGQMKATRGDVEMDRKMKYKVIGLIEYLCSDIRQRINAIDFLLFLLLLLLPLHAENSFVL